MRAFLAVVFSLMSSSQAFAQPDPFLPFARGVIKLKVPCSISADDKRLDRGTCTVNTKRITTVFVDDEETDNGYCTVDLARGAKGVVATLDAYKGPCPVETFQTKVVKQGSCWIGPRLRVCVGDRRR